MKRKLFPILTVIMICGLSVLTSCGEEDNPKNEPVVSAERQTFETEFSKIMQSIAENSRFEAYQEALQVVGNFLLGIDEKALGDQIAEILPDILENTNPTLVQEQDEEEQKVIYAALNEHFGMSEEEVNEVGGFLLVDAYNTIGKRKVTFQDGKATKGESDGFVVESIDNEGRSTSITLKFKDERDGVRIFVTRLAGVIPVCIQLPEHIEVIVNTARGVQMNGNLVLNTKAASRYISFKNSEWAGICSLTSNLSGRSETLNAYMKHGADCSFDINASVAFNGMEKLALSVKGMNKPYPEEYINSDELKSLRDCGDFFSGAYDVLKVLNGSEVENIQITLNDKFILSGKVEDVAGSLLAFGNIRKMHGTKPGFAVVDEYTQQMNKSIHFTVALKNTDIKAQGSFVTIMKGFDNMEYQPAVALQFAGEKEPMALLDRMSEKDIANYHLMIDNVNELVKSVTTLVGAVKVKFSDIKIL